MIDILVYRGDTPVDGPDIVDPLLSELSAAMARGTAEIDQAALTRPVSMRAVFRAGLQPGQLVEVMDGLQGQTWRGKLTSVDIAIEGTEITASLRISRIL